MAFSLIYDLFETIYFEKKIMEMRKMSCAASPGETVENSLKRHIRTHFLYP